MNVRNFERDELCVLGLKLYVKNRKVHGAQSLSYFLFFYQRLLLQSGFGIYEAHFHMKM